MAIDKVQAKAGECPALQTLRDQPSGVGTGEAFGVRGMPALSGTKPIGRRRGERLSQWPRAELEAEWVGAMPRRTDERSCALGFAAGNDV